MPGFSLRVTPQEGNNSDTIVDLMSGEAAVNLMLRGEIRGES